MQKLGDHKADFFSSAGRILFKSLGIFSVSLTACATVVMVLVWYDFIKYLSIQNSSEYNTLKGTSEYKIQDELHDPPGDIFTLIGIAFTFGGLALSMATIPSDLIAQIMSPENSLPTKPPPAVDELGIALAASAVVFGSSLAVGLIASLQGVICSVFARRISAQYLKSSSSTSEYSEQIRTLPKLHALLQRIREEFRHSSKEKTS
jgi:hypothetical protein